MDGGLGIGEPLVRRMQWSGTTYVGFFLSPSVQVWERQGFMGFRGFKRILNEINLSETITRGGGHPLEGSSEDEGSP
jgi:hypothetical protein